jgi:hypothetical protein
MDMIKISYLFLGPLLRSVYVRGSEREGDEYISDWFFF